MPGLRDAVLVGYVRTPFGRADPRPGVLRQVRVDDLAVVVLREIPRRTGVASGDVDGIVLGAVEMRYGLATIPGGMGQGPTTILERA